MRFARCVFLIGSLLSLLSLFVFGGVVWAEPLPEDGTATLEEVLARPEFASSSKELSWWDRFKQKVSAEIRSYVKSFFDSIDLPEFRVEDDSWISSMFDGIVEVLEFLASIAVYVFEIAPALLFAVIIGLGAFALYRVYRARKNNVRWRDTEYQSETGNEPRLSLSELLKNKDYIAMLEELRIRFRTQYHETYSLPFSVTDRRVLREIPKDAEGYALFADIVQLFEAIAFAEGSLDESRILAIAEQVEAA